MLPVGMVMLFGPALMTPLTTVTVKPISKGAPV